MRNYTILFPERVVGEQGRACSCGMVSCGNHNAQRGVRTSITANSKQEAWDKMKRQFPFEKIEVLD